MTIICAIKDPKLERVVVTSDTGASMSQIPSNCGGKWVLHNGWGLGISGDLRAVNVARHHADKLLKGIEGPYEFTILWREILKEDGFDLSPSKGGSEPNTGQNCLLVNAEQIWEVACDLSYVEILDPFYAEGCAKAAALGAAHALRDLAMEPDEVINRATRAAIETNIHCHGPIWIGQVK